MRHASAYSYPSRVSLGCVGAIVTIEGSPSPWMTSSAISASPRSGAGHSVLASTSLTLTQRPAAAEVSIASHTA